MSKPEITIAGKQIKLRDFTGLKEETIVKTFLNFIDVANTSTDRATAYNTKVEQRNAAEALHKNLYSIDRGLYGAALLLDGVTDHTRTIGVQNLLTVSDFDNITYFCKKCGRYRE